MKKKEAAMAKSVMSGEKIAEQILNALQDGGVPLLQAKAAAEHCIEDVDQFLPIEEFKNALGYIEKQN